MHTLLHWACKRDHSQIASFLIDHGADPDKVNLAGRSSRQIAQKRGLNEVFGHMNYIKPMRIPLQNTRWGSQPRPHIGKLA